MSKTNDRVDAAAKNIIQRKLVEWEGKTQCISDWARELNISPKTMSNRIRNFEKGLCTKDKCFIVGDSNKANKLTDEEQERQKNKRHRCIDSLFDAFIKHGLPKVEEEMKEYMISGAMGNALNFFIKYNRLFSTESYDQSQKGQITNLAQFANVFINQQAKPQNFTLIE